MKVSKQLLYFLLCIFICGIWTGFFWRGSMYTSNNYSSRKLVSVENLKRTFQPGLGSEDCIPKRNIFFMKTHKTAGSTVQNVLLRYSDFHNLHIGLSKLSGPRFFYQQGKTFNRQMVRDFKREINVICHHMRFNIKEVKAVMPNDTVFVTILREPGSLFESMFDYLHEDCRSFSRLPHNERGFRKFLDNTNEYFRGPLDGPFWWFAKNPLMYDLGYDNTNDNVDYIEESVSELESTFDLVLISEYFEMSLVLLKNLMCWKFEDVAYLRVNAREKSLIENITPLLKSKITNWNKADSVMYEVFNSTFWKKVKLYGIEKMELDVKKLNKISDAMVENCLEGGAVSRSDVKDPKNKVYQPHGVSMTGYNLKESAKRNRTCHNIIKTEVHWFQYLLKKESLPNLIN